MDMNNAVPHCCVAYFLSNNVCQREPPVRSIYLLCWAVYHLPKQRCLIKFHCSSKIVYCRLTFRKAHGSSWIYTSSVKKWSLHSASWHRRTALLRVWGERLCHSKLKNGQKWAKTRLATAGLASMVPCIFYFPETSSRRSQHDEMSRHTTVTRVPRRLGQCKKAVFCNQLAFKKHRTQSERGSVVLAGALLFF